MWERTPVASAFRRLRQRVAAWTTQEYPKVKKKVQLGRNMLVTEILHLDLAVSPKVELSSRGKNRLYVLFSEALLESFQVGLVVVYPYNPSIWVAEVEGSV